MKPTSRNRFLAAITLASASSILVATADTIVVPLSPVADTRLFNADWGRDLNDGSGGDLGVYQGRDRSLLRFDFSALPAGSTLEAANLVLTVSGAYGGNPNGEAMNVHRLTQSWTEGGATWNRYDGTNSWANAGGDYDATVRATSTANAGVGQSITWDVTSLAQEWFSNTTPNVGLIVINSGGTNGMHFASKDSGSLAYRPYLAATITTPAAPPSGALTWSGGGGTTGPVDGSGSWTDSDKWWNGTAFASWADGNDAILGAGGAAGVVTISGTVAPKSLWFQPIASGNYTVSGGTIDLGAATRIVHNDADGTIQSILSNGTILKQGPGKLTLAGANTHAGGTLIGNGVLEIIDGGSLGTGSVTNSGSLVFNRSDASSVSNSIAGAGPLTKSGAGSLTLSGANRYTGLTTVSGGSLSLASANALPTTGQVVIASGATVSNDAPANTSFNIGAITLTGGTLAATATPAANLGNFHLKGDVTVSGATPSTISADVRVIQNDTCLFSVADDASGVDLLVSGKLGHFNGNSWGYATKGGDGAMKLTGPVEIGGITVNGGSLILEDQAAAWGVFESINGGLKNFSAVELSVTTGTRTMSVPVTGTGTLTKTGAGTAALTASAAHSGGTTVTEGVLSLGNGTTSANLDDAAQVDIASGAKIDLNFTGPDAIGSLTLGGSPAGSGSFSATSHPDYFTGTGSLIIIAPNNGVWAATSSGNWETPANWQGNTVASGEDNTATFNGATGTTATLQANRTIGNLDFSVLDYTIDGAGILSLANTSGTSSITVASGTTATITAGLTGSVRLEKLGTGTLSLPSDGMNGSSKNTLSGETVISGGTLEIRGRSADNGGFTSIGSGPVTINTGGTLLSSNEWTTGNEWNAGNVGTITIEAGGTWTINGAGGTVRNGLILNGGIVNGNGANADWGGLYLRSTYIAAGGNATSGIAVDTALNGPTTMEVETGSQLNYSGLIHNRIQTTGSIIKSGGGTLVLSAANTYTGNTSVWAGTLVLGNGTNSSNLADGADVSVDTEATLQLNFSGSDTIDELILGGVAMSPGTYNAANSGGFITGSGSLVVQTGPPSDPFANWMNIYFTGETNPLIIGATADPDNDGIENIVEYILQGGDPSASNPGILPTVDALGTDFVFTYYRRAAATGTTQVFQHGSNLSGWTDVPVTHGGQVAITPDNPVSGIDRVVVTIPKGSSTSLFGRLSVTK